MKKIFIATICTVITAISCGTSSYVSMGCGHVNFTKINGKQVCFEKNVLVSYDYDTNNKKIYMVFVPNYVKQDFEAFLAKQDITSFNVDQTEQVTSSYYYPYVYPYSHTTKTISKDYNYKVYKFIEGLDVVNINLCTHMSKTDKTENKK
jgi:hypothetical protein